MLPASESTTDVGNAKVPAVFFQTRCGYAWLNTPGHDRSGVSSLTKCRTEFLKLELAEGL
jgi:hypothetical protein